MDDAYDKKLLYAPSPKEIIDVDADNQDTPRVMKAKKLKEIYGPNYDVPVGLADFLGYIIEDDENDLVENEGSLSRTQDDKYLNHFGPFTIIPLYYLRAMANSHLFQAMVNRNIPNKSEACHFNSTVLLFKSRFCLCHVSHISPDKEKYKKILDAEEKRLLFFLITISTLY